MKMDYKSLMAAKMKSLEDIRAQLADLDNKKTQLLQAGLEIQGAVKQLNELMQLEAPAAPAADAPAA